MEHRLLTERIHYYAPAINIVLAFTIGGNPNIEELKTAIKKAMDQHDIFRSRVVLNEEGEGYYEAIPEAVVKIELRESYDEEDWKKLIYEQERIPFDFVNGELVRYFILRKTEGIQLVMIAHHLCGDGLAITYLLRDIMTALGNPDQGTVRMPIRICSEQDIPRAARLKPHVKFLVRLGNKRWNKTKRVFRYEEFLSMFHQYWVNRQTAVEDFVISGDTLKRLQEVCRSRKITINTAIATAFLLTIGTETESGYAVSVRPEGYEGMGNFASGVSIEYEIAKNKSFWENATAIQEQLYRKIKNVKKKYFVLEFMSKIEPTIMDAIYFNAYAGYQDKLAQTFGNMFRYNGNPRGMGITNLTRLGIPSSYGSYRIEDLRFVAPIIPNSKRIIGVVTLDDNMSITMNYMVTGEKDTYQQQFKEAMTLLCSLIIDKNN
ncbi:MAG: condensation domain protein [Herbinix sp.]|jgi:NRPS condensation-like uncharacterized protein|nr:condensation domain protein [Herbinix sp.]